MPEEASAVRKPSHSHTTGVINADLIFIISILIFVNNLSSSVFEKGLLPHYLFDGNRLIEKSGICEQFTCGLLSQVKVEPGQPGSCDGVRQQESIYCLSLFSPPGSAWVPLRLLF